jgi:hypothetical protein
MKNGNKEGKILLVWFLVRGILEFIIFIFPIPYHIYSLYKFVRFVANMSYLPCSTFNFASIAGSLLGSKFLFLEWLGTPHKILNLKFTAFFSEFPSSYTSCLPYDYGALSTLL